MTRFTTKILTALLTLSLGATAAAQTAADQDITFAKEKYRVGALVSAVGHICRYKKDEASAAGFNALTLAVAELSRDDYSEILKTKGHADFVAQVDAEISQNSKSALCNKSTLSNPGVQQYAQYTKTTLVNEILHALSLSGVSECGDINAPLKPVMAEANRLGPQLSAANHPGLDALGPLSQKRASAFKKMCDPNEMFGGSYMFITNDPFGKVVNEMGKFMSGKYAL